MTQWFSLSHISKENCWWQRLRDYPNLILYLWSSWDGFQVSSFHPQNQYNKSALRFLGGIRHLIVISNLTCIKLYQGVSFLNDCSISLKHPKLDQRLVLWNFHRRGILVKPERGESEHTDWKAALRAKHPRLHPTPSQGHPRWSSQRSSWVTNCSSWVSSEQEKDAVL